MVNSKNVAFKVDKQTPMQSAPAQPMGTIINCRKPTGKRALRDALEVTTQTVPLSKFSSPYGGSGKRKRSNNDDQGNDGESPPKRSRDSRAGSPTLDALPHLRQKARDLTLPSAPAKKQIKATRLRASRPIQSVVDLDCWYTIMTFSQPSLLLQMREKIPSFYRFLRDSPAIWKHSRDNVYGSDLPDPPPGLTEFQYADLRHGHGCMSCGASATRKTYWAFLRRWCKKCFQKKTIKEERAVGMAFNLNRDWLVDDNTIIRACVPSGIVDSWGNFVGAGPAQNASLKTVYLMSDVSKLVREYVDLTHPEGEPEATVIDDASTQPQVRAWRQEKMNALKLRIEFAQRMEQWEVQNRNERSCDYQGKKSGSKSLFHRKRSHIRSTNECGGDVELPFLSAGYCDTKAAKYGFVVATEAQT